MNHISEVYSEDSKRIVKNVTLNYVVMSKGIEHGKKQRICDNRVLVMKPIKKCVGLRNS